MPLKHYILPQGTSEEAALNPPNLHVIAEDTDSDVNNASSDCEAFSEPSSVSSLDSSRLCVTPQQVQGIPRSAESQTTRTLEIPKRMHRRSFSAVEPIHNPLLATKIATRRRRCYSMSDDQMEDKENFTVEKLVRPNSANKVHTRRQRSMEDLTPVHQGELFHCSLSCPLSESEAKKSVHINNNNNVEGKG